jgi:type IV pilus assembly protein PilE
MRRLPGFSLLELLVSLAILVILLGIALPGYRQSVIKANRAVGKLALMEVAARQERYWQDHHSYSASLVSLGLVEPYYLDGTAESVGRERAVYEIRLDWVAGQYQGVSATPRNGQAEDRDCGTLIYGPQGQRRVTGRHRAAPQRCW